jgi:heat shock protein HtpX
MKEHDSMRGKINILKTTGLLAVLGGLFVLVGFYLGGNAGALSGLLLGLFAAGISYWFSDRLALVAAHVRPVSAEEAPALFGIVRDLTAARGMPMPRIYITPHAQPNAFATGRNERHAAVAVTQGILQILEEDELRGVLAHELSHVHNRDILIGSVAAAIAMAITFVARILMWGGVYGGGRRDRRTNPLGLIALVVLAPLAATIVQLALSRARESEADLSGAELIGAGYPLAQALRKMERSARQIPMDVDPAHATAYIVNPLAGRRINFAGLFSTHPQIGKRIAALEEYDRSMGRRIA